MQYGVILAGGAGTRLWPMSRNDRPKQLLSVIQGKNLLQLSYERLRQVLPAEQIYICAAGSHGASMLEALPEVPRTNLLSEPLGRDTANAVGYAAAVLHKKDPDAVTAVVTADHVIEPVEEFARALRRGFEVVQEYPSTLVTFGIIPMHGHTGLGYIHRGEALPLRSGEQGAYRVQAFREKPDKPTADRYVESGRYYWNSGMFVWRCDTVLNELATHLQPSYRGLMQINEAWGTPRQQEVLNEVYPRLPKISIDYAMMEPVSQGRGKAQVVVVEMPVKWLDIGSWPALAETFSIDDHDNAMDCVHCALMDSDGNIIVSRDPEHVVAVVGISDLVVVHTPDATLVCPKQEAQRVKELVGRLREKFGEKYQ
jgi:mannose-1-phosphate guanylyltransferase